MIGLLRSMLYVPGVRQDRFGKAMSAGADAVVFDLEDSVEAGQKEKARSLIAEFLATPSTGPMRLVRFNAVHSSEGEADLEFFSTRTGFDGVLLPKVETVGLVETVARVFARHAPGGGVPPLFVMLETPTAVLRAGDIVTADAPISGLLFGAEDFTAALGVERTTDGEELLYARGQIALAAAAARADAIDAVFTDLNDPDGLRRDCLRARGLGFRGKMAIHPKQIEVINEAFTPAPAEVERARRVIDAYETARAAGQAVTTLEGKMIELPIVERARRVLQLVSR
jgi:citrate lyase subunit beta/citryl-CoA lyase